MAEPISNNKRRIAVFEFIVVDFLGFLIISIIKNSEL